MANLTNVHPVFTASTSDVVISKLLSNPEADDRASGFFKSIWRFFKKMSRQVRAVTGFRKVYEQEFELTDENGDGFTVLTVESLTSYVVKNLAGVVVVDFNCKQSNDQRTPVNAPSTFSSRSYDLPQGKYRLEMQYV